MLAVYKRELKSYFTSGLGFVFLAFFLVIVGIFFLFYNLVGLSAEFSNTLNGVLFLFILLIPILTMKIIAEENKQKTDQLLYTAPVSIEKIVIGKYLAVETLFFIAVAVISTYPLILSKYGKVELAIAYSAILGFFLVGSAYIAIGLFISSLTESQVIAAVISFVVLLFTYLMSGLASMLPNQHIFVWLVISFIVLVLCFVMNRFMHNYIITTILGVALEAYLLVMYLVKPAFYDGLLVKIMDWFSINQRFTNFAMGILDITALIYYLSVAFIFVFLTVQKIKKKRWS